MFWNDVRADFLYSVIEKYYEFAPDMFHRNYLRQGCSKNYWQVTKVVPAVTPEVKDSLVKNIKRRMTPQPLKIRADVEMKCFQFDGVLHIKVILTPVAALFFNRGVYKMLILYVFAASHEES